MQACTNQSEALRKKMDDEMDTLDLLGIRTNDHSQTRKVIFFGKRLLRDIRLTRREYGEERSK